MENNKEYKGFLEPKSDPNDFIFGVANKLGIEPLTDGHWLAYLPTNYEEIQIKGFDTYGCTSFGTSNCLEVLFKRLGQDKNFSDRFIGIVAGTYPPGNDPKTVAEAVRKNGLVKEESLPFSDSIRTVDEYYSPKPVTKPLQEEGTNFLIQNQLGYEWVGSTASAIKDALKLSPLGISVTAWFQDEKGLYYFPAGMSPNHWTCLIDFKEGEYWTVLDSYPPYIKNIAWNSNFKYILRYEIKPGIKDDVAELTKKVSFLAWLIGLFVKKKLEEIKPVLTVDEMTTPEVIKPKVSRIPDWARAVQFEEGWWPNSVSFRSNNPGNLKFSGLTESFGATRGIPAGDGGYFCKFSTYEKGFTALCEFLTLGAKDQLKAYHQARTLRLFTRVYAHPPTDGYSERIAQKLGVSPDINIKELL